MYDDIDRMEKDFNERMHTLRERLLDTETLVRELFNDSLWDEEDRDDLRASFAAVKETLDQISGMFE